MTRTDFDIRTKVMRKFNYTVKQKAVPILELLLFYKVILLLVSSSALLVVLWKLNFGSIVLTASFGLSA